MTAICACHVQDPANLDQASYGDDLALIVLVQGSRVHPHPPPRDRNELASSPVYIYSLVVVPWWKCAGLQLTAPEIQH